jgi:glycosyltransferase involved in cell wall biosynthesis
MRRFAAGTISYTYSDRLKAISEVPGQPVWVAANSLYRADRIRPASSDRPRTDIVYVGRFERAKKVELLIEGYAIFAATCPEARLVLAGDGGQLPALRGKVRDLGLGERVVFAGWISDYKALKEVYSTAVCSASPGFAGLGLTQSLGFGVPCVVADSEPHSPEIELATEDSVIWFESNDAADLGRALALAWRDRGELPREDLSADIAERYSAEAMARGLSGALRNTDPESASTERAPRER